MSGARVQTQAGLDAPPRLPVRRLHNFTHCSRSMKVLIFFVTSLACFQTDSLT